CAPRLNRLVALIHHLGAECCLHARRLNRLARVQANLTYLTSAKTYRIERYISVRCDVARQTHARQVTQADAS
ncbi:MAG: hypothetical protein AAFX40_03840, partial [Cyanobacteria bacterium J06639_1]